MAELNKQIWQPNTPLSAVPMNEKAAVIYQNGVLRYNMIHTFRYDSPTYWTLLRDMLINADVIIDGTVIDNLRAKINLRENTYTYLSLNAPGGSIAMNVSYLRPENKCIVFANRMLPSIVDLPGYDAYIRIFTMPEIGVNKSHAQDTISADMVSGNVYISGATLLADIMWPRHGFLNINGTPVEIYSQRMRLPYTTIFDQMKYSLVFIDGGWYVYPHLSLNTVVFSATGNINSTIPAGNGLPLQVSHLIDILPVAHSFFTQTTENQTAPRAFKKDIFFGAFRSGNYFTMRILELTPGTSSWYLFSSNQSYAGNDADISSNVYDYGTFLVPDRLQGIYGDFISNTYTSVVLLCAYRDATLAGRLNLWWDGNWISGTASFSNTGVTLTRIVVPKKSPLPFFACGFLGDSGTTKTAGIAWYFRDYTGLLSGTRLIHSGAAAYFLYGVQPSLEGNVFVLLGASGVTTEFGANNSAIYLCKYNIFAGDLTIFTVYDEKEAKTYSAGYPTVNTLNGALGLEPDLMTPFAFLQSGAYLSPVSKYEKENFYSAMSGFVSGSVYYPGLPQGIKLTYVEAIADGYYLLYTSGNTLFYQIISNKFVTPPTLMDGIAGGYPATYGYIISFDNSISTWYATRTGDPWTTGPWLKTATPFTIKKHSSGVFELEVNI